MSSLTVFNFQSQEIRFVGGKPVANDVAVVLGYADAASTVSKKVKDKNKSVAKLTTVDGKQREVTVLEEAGIYQLIFSSKLPSAEVFQNWVFDEVLPTIRKTGSYGDFKETVTKFFTPMEVVQTLLDLEQSSLPAHVKQLLLDSTVNYHITGNQKAIAPSSEVKTPLGVVEIAERLGYSPNHSTRPSLGRYVSNNCSEFKTGQEKRLCNGKMLPINLYEDCIEVEQAIIAFFEGAE